MTALTLPAKRGEPRKTLSEASDRDLHFWGKKIADGLKADPNKPYADKDRVLVEGIRAELQRRKAGAAQAAERRSQALAKAATTTMGRAIQDPEAITQHLVELSQNYHIVSPATRVDVLPEGCGVAISYVVVDPNTDKDGPKEVYEVGGRLGLSGDTLKRIAAAAGLDWDPRQCGRLDDGRDPHYCHYRAVGYVRNFDGSIRTVTGEVEMDMREGSPQIEEIRAKSAAAAKKYDKPDDGGVSQIRELRKFLLRHAESKAKNRAIADMGVKRSYAPAELQKPFAVARLTWTGETSDPELRRVFAEKTADAMIGGISALYGRQPAALPQRAPSAPEFSGHAPPPVGSVTDDLDDTYDWDTDGEAVPKSEPKASPAAAAPKAEPVGEGYDARGDDPDAY